MKRKILFSSLCVLFALSLKAQGNLQFNQVLNIENGMNYTVPTGKVLKIESINYVNPSAIVNYSSCTINCPGCGASSGVTCYYTSINYLRIGNNIYSASTAPGGVYINSGGACSVCPATQTLSVSPTNLILPIWLGSGKNVNVLASGIFISAIEFNIVP